MTGTETVSMRLHTARKEIEKAHGHADTWSEDMEHTMKAIDALGIQHYGRGGEDVPERILNAQVDAMAALTYTYSEQAYETDEMTFYDDNERDLFEEHLEAGHDAAMKALREMEGRHD